MGSLEGVPYYAAGFSDAGTTLWLDHSHWQLKVFHQKVTHWQESIPMFRFLAPTFAYPRRTERVDAFSGETTGNAFTSVMGATAHWTTDSDI
jgi:hypothetical protein